MLSYGFNIVIKPFCFRVPAHLTSQCLKNGPRRRLGARRPPRWLARGVAAHLTSRLKIWPRRRLGGRPEDSHDNLRLQHCYQGILFQTACSFNQSVFQKSA
ncbi:unnamed protein product [Prunus armeniaca]